MAQPEAGGRAGRGFAALGPEQRREAARKGAAALRARGMAHRFDPEAARTAGRKGGLSVSRDRARMAELGRKGGRAVSQDREHMRRIGRVGGRKATGSGAG